MCLRPAWSRKQIPGWQGYTLGFISLEFAQWRQDSRSSTQLPLRAGHLPLRPPKTAVGLHGAGRKRHSMSNETARLDSSTAEAAMSYDSDI